MLVLKRREKTSAGVEEWVDGKDPAAVGQLSVRQHGDRVEATK